MSKSDLEIRIKMVHRNIARWTRTMEAMVHELDNTMNECDCEDRKVFDFRNVSTEEEVHVLCLNCGGYIQVQDLEDCGMF